MKKRRAPVEWTHMHPGDQIRSDLDLQSLATLTADLKGYSFRFEPAEIGNWIICTESPRPLRPWEQTE